MARDRIKSRALFKREVWIGQRESAEQGGIGFPRPSSCNTDLESSDLVFEDESGFVLIKGAWYDSGSASETIPFVSPVLSSMAAESPAGSKLPSSNSVRCSGSKARAAVEAANPWKIKAPRISET